MSTPVIQHYFESYEGYLTIIKHRYFYAGLIVAVFFLLRKFVVNRLFDFLSKKLKSRLANGTASIRTEIAHNVFDAVAKSLHKIFFIIGLIIAVMVAQLNARLEVPIIHLLESLILLYLGIGIYYALKAVQRNEQHLYELFNKKFDKILIEFTLQIILVLVLAITGLMIMQVWGFNVSTFIAGLGLGGLAVALAAKDLVANIFAGFVIITDKPYSIGDWIDTPSCEGTVEDITFRSTKIRTFANALVTVPNATLIAGAVTNWTKMQKRRVNFTLSVDYKTPISKLECICRNIETMLRDHPEIHQDIIFVRFNEIADSSLKIFVYYFTKTTVWGEYLRVREDTLMQMLDIIRDEGVTIAIPIRSIISKEEPQPSQLTGMKNS